MSNDLKPRIRFSGAMLVGIMVAMVSGCSHVQEPWTGNGGQYKTEMFKTKLPSQALDQRLLTGQTDR